ncbi:sugar efflux transporter [Photobacterium sp. TY1-4]|uniref:sugar efflux transporter n=1 Tax=Photobacterium sp. TY1-4 TaxID=2899122 RepID=UPI0021C17660|nr:sugar efflux transporter [Photobacterium sp. TY1-4]UXI02568.1 sugar efflux transporter [Photobacterium sp. TY1-4]
MYRSALQFFRGEGGRYFFINGFTALAFSFILPIMSLFLVKQLGLDPSYIGVYTVSVAVSGMVISHRLGALSDRGVADKKLFLFGVSGIAAAAVGFSLATAFWQVLLTGVLFMGLGSASIPMILAMIRRYAESSGQDSTRINSQMRSSVSLVWIIGPALAFASVEHLGFQGNFFLAGTIAVLVGLYAWQGISGESRHRTQPVLPALEPKTPDTAQIGRRETTRLPKRVWILGMVIFLANIANSTYITSIPLYLTETLGMSTSFPGILIGLTAAFEIPVMLLSARWASRYGKRPVILCSFVLAAVFYTGLQLAETPMAFVVLQVFNGLFFGIFVGLGISLLQDEAPAHVGKASAFYTNAMAVGTMAGTSLMGVVAGAFGYQQALLISLGAISLAFVLLLAIELRARRMQSQQMCPAQCASR